MSDDELYESECEHAGSEPNQPESQYHDGSSNGEKRRKNTKITSINRVMYIHEDSSLAQLLDTTIKTLNQVNNLQLVIGNHSNRLCPNNFTAKYTIPRTSYKDVDITSIKDFDVLITEVQKQRSPAFKLLLTQTKLLENGSENEDKEEEEEEPRRKTSKPNSKETKLNEHIAELLRLYTCEDQSCKFPICWPSPTDAKHVHLTPLHLKTWAAAIIAAEKNPDIQTDYESPLNTKLFDPASETSAGNIALLSRQRQGTGNMGTSIIVNNDFKELANVLVGDRRPVQLVLQPISQNRPRPELVPKMTLEAFCDRYDLSIFILQKLDVMKVTGPHGLRFISNEQLFDIGHLNVGEVADMHNAHERWMLGPV
ncbi:hypothetical protein BU15DRAFT_59018 [Melanogaster broomeanus]|nr:hypothetical protein BU15DRAFT_59018 [Melanogaster broomeanus]